MPPRIPRVQLLAPTRSVERTGGQSTFLAPMSGTQRLGDGVYYINPHEASYGKSNPLEILRQQAAKMSDMAALAEQRGAHDPKRRYGMIESALEDAVLAAAIRNEEMRLLMQVNQSGSPVSALTFQKGDVYGLGPKNLDLNDLDFTSGGQEPGTLHSLGALGMLSEDRPMIPGHRLIQKAQDALGNDNVFLQTIDRPAEPFSNVGYYYGLGARATGKHTGTDPFYEFKKRAAREPEEPSTDQLRLPGFAGGGALSRLIPKSMSNKQFAKLKSDFAQKFHLEFPLDVQQQIANYQEGDAGYINRILRNMPKNTNIYRGKNAFLEARLLDKAFELADPFPTDTLLFRGVVPGSYPGTERGYLSTTQDKRVADSWQAYGDEDRQTNKLIIPKGIPYVIPSVSGQNPEFDMQKELMFPRGLRVDQLEGDLYRVVPGMRRGGLVQYKECHCGG